MGNLFSRFEGKAVPTSADIECCAKLVKSFAKAEARSKAGDYNFTRPAGSLSVHALLGDDYDPDGFSIPQF